MVGENRRGGKGGWWERTVVGGRGDMGHDENDHKVTSIVDINVTEPPDPSEL